MNAKSIISFKLGNGYGVIVLPTPLKQLTIAHRLTLCSVAFVFRINSLPEVLGVREIQGDIGGVVLCSEVADVLLKGSDDFLQIADNRDEIFTPIKLFLIDLAGTVGKEVSINPKINGSLPTMPLLSLRRRGELGGCSTHLLGRWTIRD